MMRLLALLALAVRFALHQKRPGGGDGPDGPDGPSGRGRPDGGNPPPPAEAVKPAQDLAKERLEAGQPPGSRGREGEGEGEQPGRPNTPEAADPFLDPNGEQHVRDRHFPGGKYNTPGTSDTPGDSTFDPDVDPYELADDAFDVDALPQANGRYVRVRDAGRIIGTDENGLPTSTYTVVQLPSGKVWTMHPGRPRD